MSIEEFDHPCKMTCSGWKQGFEKGKAAGALAAFQVCETRIKKLEAVALAARNLRAAFKATSVLAIGGRLLEFEVALNDLESP